MDHFSHSQLSKEERMWGTLCHLSAFAIFLLPFGGNFLGPLVVYLLKKNDYPFVADQGIESLNFQISLLIYTVISAMLIIVLIGLIGLFLIPIIGFIFVVIASLRANDGVRYRYPFTIRILR
ncbi:DUF4870 domain-containing protein [Bacillus horti]|uniref:DUF4870 domain-containing protein n=1 Tax=Caldalkalibacillus horti TaxID=77523 RepID=UPI0027D8FA56|nr:DUF4870 domain-containing protein [Bacillus horti]